MQRLTEADALWTAQTKNEKTGNVPTLWVGRNQEACESSCGECPHFKTTCYAWRGRVGIGAKSIWKAVKKKPQNYTLKRALKKRAREARMVRLSAIGDIAALPKRVVVEAVEEIKANCLDVVGFTSMWRQHPWLREFVLASCRTLEEADEAIDLGWKVAVTLPKDHEGVTWTTPKGRTGQVCSAIISKHFTCNICRKCKVGPGPHQGFPLHR